MNENNCIVCNCDYKVDKACRSSTKIDVYCKHLGCCKKDCYDKLPHKTQTHLKLSAFLRNYWNRVNGKE